MSEWAEHNRGDCDARQVEAMISAAGRYIRPSDELRPRTLEAARRACDDRRAEQRLGGFMVAALLLMLIASPTLTYLKMVQWNSVTTAAEINQRARTLATQREIGNHWGLAEAYSQLRTIQADRLGFTGR